MNYLTKTKSHLQNPTIVKRESNLLPKWKINKLIACMLFVYLAHLSPLISNAQFCSITSGASIFGTISTNTTISNNYLRGTSSVITIGNGIAPVILTLNKVEFNVLETKKIVVTKNATLSIIQTHIFSCNWAMWDGIEVQPGGAVIINGNSLIEDAICGINYLKNGSTTPYFYPSSSFALKTDEVIFNRCKIGIQIDEYNYTHPTIASSTTQVLPGFEVIRTVFTSRDLTYSTLFSWVTYTNLVASAAGGNSHFPFSSDYIDDKTYPVLTLRDPTQGIMPQIGLFLNKVGNCRSNCFGSKNY